MKPDMHQMLPMILVCRKKLYAADYLTYSPHCSIFNDFFALEMLTDHSLPSEDSMSSDKPNALYNNINEPLHTAQEMATAHKVAFLYLA